MKNLVASMFVFAMSLILLPKVNCQYCTLSSIIYKVGIETGQLFTIEESIMDSEPMGKWLDQRVPSDLSKRLKNPDILDLVNTHLKSKFTYRRAKSGNVVHIIDVRLSNYSDNPLDRIVPHIEFTGDSDNFVNRIHEFIPQICLQLLFPTWHRTPPCSCYPKVKIKAENLSVRELLTKAVENQEKRCHVIWSSVTNIDNGLTSLYYR